MEKAWVFSFSSFLKLKTRVYGEGLGLIPKLGNYHSDH